jgi:6-phosphogluconolactonase
VAELHTLSPQEVFAQAAQRIAEDLRAAISMRGWASLAIPGGSAISPIAPLRNILGADWQKVRLTWVDERCAPQASADSNRGEAYRQGALDPGDAPDLELPLWLDDDDPASARARVSRSLEQDFAGALDVALLGMGPDGHVASLFPGHPLLRSEDECWVQYLDDSPKPPARRMTLSLGFLKRTRASYLIAFGQSKRDALLRVLQSDPELPLSTLDPLVILTDLDLGASP